MANVNCNVSQHCRFDVRRSIDKDSRRNVGIWEIIDNIKMSKLPVNKIQCLEDIIFPCDFAFGNLKSVDSKGFDVQRLGEGDR
jgi:hypothetical protein